PINPGRVLAESQKATEILKSLDSGEGGVAPAVAKRAQRCDVELLQQSDALVLAERDQFPFQQLPAFAKRGLRKMPCLRVLEIKIERTFDRGHVCLDETDLARSFPAMDDPRCGAPVARVQRILDPLAAQRSLDPDPAVAARPAPSLRAMRT